VRMVGHLLVEQLDVEPKPLGVAAQQPSFRGRSGGQHRQRDENDACERESD
jgi:hypothetical protein